MDPIGTIRRESFGVHQYAIWLRQDPGYPDNQMTETDWTCVWSTDPAREGTRLGAAAIEQTDHPIVGVVPGTPAETGSDVEVGNRVETRSGALYWTSEPVRGRIEEILGDHYFRILFDEPQRVEGEFPTVYTSWALQRVHFELMEDES